MCVKRGTEKVSCDICGKYQTFRKDNLKRHKLVCLKRLTNACLADSPFSNSSRVSDNVNENEVVAIAPSPINNGSGSNGMPAAAPSPIRNRSGSNDRNAVTPSPIRNRSGRNRNRRLCYDKIFPCSICQRPHHSMASRIAHERVHTSEIPANIPTSMSNEFARIILSQHAFGGHACDYDLLPNETCSDVLQFFQMSASLVQDLLRALSPSYILKGRMIARVRTLKLNNTGQVEKEVFLYFASHSATIVDNDYEAWYNSHSTRIIEALDEFSRQSSDLQIDCIERVYVKLNLANNANGQGLFTLPPKIAKTKSIVNVNTASECFKYALLSVLHYNDVSRGTHNRPYSYREWVGELDFGDLDVNNISISDVSKIEKLNNLKINVHVWEGTVLTIRYNNNRVIAPKTVNVLLVIHNGLRHYCGIINLKGLYHHKSNITNDPKVFCERCCRSLGTKRRSDIEVLNEHYQFCREGRLQIEALPSNKEYCYTQFSHEESPVLVCYSDIECYIDPQAKKHRPAMIGMYECYHSHFTRERENAQMRNWHGDQCLENYLAYLDKLVRELNATMHSRTCQPMSISVDQQCAFDKAKRCPKCTTAFTADGKHRKVRDHCHITGNYRGPLCHQCNSRLRLKRRVLPVIFHNFKGYDGHLICKRAIGAMKHWKLNVIPITHEKYMSLSANVEVGKTKKGKTIYFTILFLDSFQFLSSSLATLVGNLDHLPITESHLRALHPGISDAVIRRKGVYPYSYFNSLSRLEETSLPPIEAFKDDLTGANCSLEDYAHAKRAWSEFQCRNFRMYTAKYMNLDIYLLADVFEQFRALSLQEDGLDPVHFVSLPGLSYMACFKRTREKIDLLQDIDMVRMFERGIRGGLTFVNKHQVEARIPELGNNQDGNVHLTYIDQNNLYGSSLCRPLPHSEFSWLDEEELKHFSDSQHILDLEDEGEWGYLFEVDLVYPRELHTSTADFPLAPESGIIEKDMFSPFMKSYYTALCHDRGNTSYKYHPTRKLLLTQYDKEQYVCHYSILKFYLKMGMVLTRVRSAIRFRQKRFVEPYIKYNSDRRACALNAFEKDFYKLKNNSFFGKTMEDVRHRINFKLITDKSKLDELENSPLFLDRDIFSTEVVGVHMFKAKVVLDKPIYIGQAVLDYSKLEMYNLYYNILKKCPLIKQPDLVGGDTDSFFLALHCNKEITLHAVFTYLREYFDSSNYPQDHPLFSVSNKAKLGCFKDETAGKIIEEMICLRPKMYSMKLLGQETAIKRAKGISRHLVTSTSHNTYREAFLSQKETSYQMTIFRSRLHTIETVTFRKRGLSAWEDKRCWLEANSSVPHGSYLSGLPPKRRRVFPTPYSGDVSIL